ncbi:MAG: type I phosphomannose isomerase catalytic subunit, partial [Bacteroidota bacterium]
MNSSHHTYALQGVVQPYAWGGYEFLSQLLGHDNSDGEPQAEYWLGIHPKGAAEVQLSAGATPLPDFLAAHPALLGDEVQQQFGELPFLFKILDVRQMLSIQLHPTIPVAEVGFAREEAAG